MSQPLYQRLAENLQQQIAQGILSPGDKLPSVRRFSEEQQISHGTVISCYNLLEKMNLIEARPQSGYYVTEPTPTLVNQPKAIATPCNPVEVTLGNLALQVMTLTDSKNKIPMGAAYPSKEFPMCKQLWREMARQARLQGQQDITAPQGYSVPPGEAELIRQLARQYGPLSLDINQESLVITNGCQEALSLSLQATTSLGDIIAVESPLFYGTLQLIEALGLKVIEIPAIAEQGLSLEALKLALQQWPVKAVLTTANIGNPLGYLMPDSKKQELLSILKQYDLPLIEDDVFGDLTYGPGRPLPIKAFDTEGRVLWCSSISKSIDPGIRVGWVSAGRYNEQIRYLKYVSTMASPGITQLTVSTLLQGSSYPRHLRLIKQTYQRRRDQMIHWVQRYLPEATRMTFPQGGFLLWLELPDDTADSLLLHQQALQHKISIAPGILFSATKNYRHCIRLNYGCAGSGEYGQAVKQLASLL